MTRDLSRLSDEELRAAIHRGLARDVRREFECKLAWRDCQGRHVAHTFVPALLLVDPADRRQ
jgi:hypothetical protein